LLLRLHPPGNTARPESITRPDTGQRYYTRRRLPEPDVVETDVALDAGREVVEIQLNQQLRRDFLSILEPYALTFCGIAAAAFTCLSIHK
jgi:hypothetical protein